MEDSFRVYLPSNASMNTFPNNKPSDYQVELNPPLTFDGEWEVGVENVCYDSAIENEDVEEEMVLKSHFYEKQSMNDIFDFSFVLTDDGKWNYGWYRMKLDLKDVNNTELMLKALNALNADLLKDKNKKAFEFSTYKWRKHDLFKFHSYCSSLTVRFSAKLSLHLGFGHGVHVSGTSPNKGGLGREYQTKRLKESDLEVKFFDQNVVQCEKRFILKRRGENPFTLDELLEKWNATVGTEFGIMSKRVNKKFVIVANTKDKRAICLSDALQEAIRHYTAIIAGSTFFASRNYFCPHYAFFDEWWVDVYGDYVNKAPTLYREMKHTVSTQPRQYPTVEAFIKRINPYLAFHLKDMLRDNYDAAKHHISFTILDRRTVIRVGPQMECYLSDNLMKLFGFSQKKFTKSHTTSDDSPITLDKREQHLFIQSDLIAPISYGGQKEYILRDFIHDKDAKYGILEKRFNPIFYHPVIKQYIPNIAIKITNGLHERIHLTDTKTLITLIFRKAK
jgi:hypothetical protein